MTKDSETLPKLKGDPNEWSSVNLSEETEILNVKELEESLWLLGTCLFPTLSKSQALFLLIFSGASFSIRVFSSHRCWFILDWILWRSFLCSFFLSHTLPCEFSLCYVSWSYNPVSLPQVDFQRLPDSTFLNQAL